jgi:DNA-binding NarL/FixJ family response regulator
MTGDRVRELLEAGHSRSDIARTLGVSHSTVSRYAQRFGFSKAKPRNPACDWAAVRAYYDAGHTVRECQERFGFSIRAWREATQRGDVSIRKTRLPAHASEKRALIAEMLSQGWLQAQIAAELGMSKPTVSYHARRLGVPTRDEFARRYDWSAIQKAHDSGLSMRECAARFGFSKDAWHSAVRRGELVPRPHDGDGLDNRLENLKLLCANCHSQTPNYGGRNGHRKPRRRDVTDGGFAEPRRA